MLTVLATGPRALLQDRGRPGLAESGVGRSGAADRASYELANRLLANPPGVAVIEVLLGGLRLRAERDVTVALCGAPGPATVAGKPVGHNAVVPVQAGDELAIGAPGAGLRTYVAVRGGFAVPPVLGSRSTDTLSGIGPPALDTGARLPVGPTPAEFPLIDVAPVADPAAGTLTLRVSPGARADWAADPAALLTTRWTVSPDSDRVGVRLQGEPLRRRDDELHSEGLVRGAVQLPPGGQPVLFLADHPLTGGYPVIAVVTSRDVDRAAQARPGQRIRFRQV